MQREERASRSRWEAVAELESHLAAVRSTRLFLEYMERIEALTSELRQNQHHLIAFQTKQFAICAKANHTVENYASGRT